MATDNKKRPAIDISQLADEDVRRYLAKRNDFFLDHPDLFSILALPGREQGASVVDFQAYALGALRHRLNELDDVHDDLMHAVRSNMTSQSRVHEAALAAIDADSFETLAHVVTAQWPDMLDVDAVTLSFEAGAKAARITLSGVQVLDAGYIEKALGKGKAVLLRGDVKADPHIFGAAADLVKAEALVRLDLEPPTPRGLIAFGSRDGAAFAPGQGTELLKFLAAVLQRCIKRWMTQVPL